MFIYCKFYSKCYAHHFGLLHNNRLDVWPQNVQHFWPNLAEHLIEQIAHFFQTNKLNGQLFNSKINAKLSNRPDVGSKLNLANHAEMKSRYVYTAPILRVLLGVGE